LTICALADPGHMGSYALQLILVLSLLKI
jgi:hypothetical protein